MRPLDHFIISLIAASIIYFYSAHSAVFIYPFVLMTGFLIDIDHNLWFIYRYKNWNIKQCWKYYKKKRTSMYDQLLIFHTIEFALLISVLAVFYSWAALMFFSLMLHYTLDAASLEYKRVAHPSIVGWFLK